jgi:hypothetical protein
VDPDARPRCAIVPLRVVNSAIFEYEQLVPWPPRRVPVNRGHSTPYNHCIVSFVKVVGLFVQHVTVVDTMRSSAHGHGEWKMV